MKMATKPLTDTQKAQKKAEELVAILKKVSETQNKGPISSLLGNMRTNAAIIAHQLECIQEFHDIEDKPVLLWDNTGGQAKYATKQQKLNALLRATRPQNIIFDKED